MQGFWKLISVLIALAGFTTTGIVLLMQGDGLVDVVLKSIAVFAVLYFVQKYLGGILIPVLSSNPQDAGHADNQPKPGTGG
jgi:hypothetical protein